MKTLFLVLFLFALTGCDGSKPQINVPPDADLKADVMFQGTGSSRAIEVSFYFSRPVAPGDKREPKLEIIPLDDVRFNDQPLTASVNAVGRHIYTAQSLQVKAENVITGTLNGKPYEGKAIPQTTLASKSVTVVMTPK
jgi:predicted small lipoprotein YifL